MREDGPLVRLEVSLAGSKGIALEPEDFAHLVQQSRLGIRNDPGLRNGATFALSIFNLVPPKYLIENTERKAILLRAVFKGAQWAV